MCLMLFSATMIQAQLGRLEMHFHSFAALIAVHHVVLTVLQLSEATVGGMPLMLFNYGCSWSITAVHAIFVVFEADVLSFFAVKRLHALGSMAVVLQ